MYAFRISCKSSDSGDSGDSSKSSDSSDSSNNNNNVGLFAKTSGEQQYINC